MEGNIQTAPVRVVKNEFGNMNPEMTGASLTGNESVRHISCTVTDLGTEYLLKTGIDENCGFTPAGTKTPVLDTNSIETRHLQLPEGGHLWIVAADFAPFKEKCAACCVS